MLTVFYIRDVNKERNIDINNSRKKIYKILILRFKKVWKLSITQKIIKWK